MTREDIEDEDLDWSRTLQFIENLDDPTRRLDQIRERIAVDNDDMTRTVSLRLAVQPGDTEILVSVVKPRKLLAQPVDVERVVGGSARVLSHREHSRLASWLIAYRFRSVTRIASEHGLITEADEPLLQETVLALLDLVDASPRSSSDLDPLLDLFDKQGWLLRFPNVASPTLAVAMTELHALCQELVDRYYKVIAVTDIDREEVLLEYSYLQETEARLYGNTIVRRLRRWFRAPGSSLLVHVPLSRSTCDYELHLEPIAGYYVSKQEVLESPEDGADLAEDRPASERGAETYGHVWWSNPRGARSSASVFVGNGVASRHRLYVSLRLHEIPPGATGRAFAVTGLGTGLLVAIVGWSLLHRPSESASMPETFAALVALGSAVVDNLTPSNDVFNAPLTPRVALFLQTVAALLIAVWLLARGTAADLLHPLWNWLVPLVNGLGLADPWIGFGVVCYSVIQFIFIANRALAGIKQYDDAMVARRG